MKAYRDSSPGRSPSPLKTIIQETALPTGGEAGAAEISEETNHSAEAYLTYAASWFLCFVYSSYSVLYVFLCSCRLLQQYQSNTAPKDFVYLRRVAANPADYNPYILRVSKGLLSSVR